VDNLKKSLVGRRRRVKLDKLSPLVDELRDFKAEQTVANDQIITILKCLDDERHFTAVWSQRVEEGLKMAKKVVGRHERELRAVRERLAM